jgi:hypothetical protein
MTTDHDTGVSMSPHPPQDSRWAIFAPASYKNRTLGDSELTDRALTPLTIGTDRAQGPQAGPAARVGSMAGAARRCTRQGLVKGCTTTYNLLHGRHGHSQQDTPGDVVQPSRRDAGSAAVTQPSDLPVCY